MSKQTGQQGYIVLMSVVLLSAVSAAVAASLVLLGLSASRSGFLSEQSAQARSLANACAEQALESLRENTAYAGGEALSLGNGQCEIEPVAFDGSAYTISASGTQGEAVRKVKVEAQPDASSTQMQILSWQELADF